MLTNDKLEFLTNLAFGQYATVGKDELQRLKNLLDDLVSHGLEDGLGPDEIFEARRGLRHLAPVPSDHKRPQGVAGLGR